MHDAIMLFKQETERYTSLENQCFGLKKIGYYLAP